MKKRALFTAAATIVTAIVLLFSISIWASAAWTPPFDALPSAEDFEAIGADIVYPSSESMYLDAYKTAVVNRKAVYAFKDPMTKHDPMREGNYFTVTRGTEVTVLAESSGYSCVIINETRTAGWINSDYLDPIEKTAFDYSEGVTSNQTGLNAGPSSSDLDAIHADIVYPSSDSMYLENYKIAVINRNAVYAFKDPMTKHDPMRKGNYYTVTRGTEVTVLAESSGYSCVIINETQTAGWINSNYLEVKQIVQQNNQTYTAGTTPVGPGSSQGGGREIRIPANPKSTFGKAYKDNMDGVYYSDRDKADLVSSTYYDRKDSNGNRRAWYSSSYYDDPITGYRINYYYADGILFFADAYHPGERSSVTFYFWGDELIACHDLRIRNSSLSFNGDADYNNVVREFGDLYSHTDN